MTASAGCQMRDLVKLKQLQKPHCVIARACQQHLRFICALVFGVVLLTCSPPPMTSQSALTGVLVEHGDGRPSFERVDERRLRVVLPPPPSVVFLPSLVPSAAFLPSLL